MLRDPAFFWRPNNTASRGRGGGKNRSATKFRKNAPRECNFLNSFVQDCSYPSQPHFRYGYCEEQLSKKTVSRLLVGIYLITNRSSIGYQKLTNSIKIQQAQVWSCDKRNYCVLLCPPCFLCLNCTLISDLNQIAILGFTTLVLSLMSHEILYISPLCSKQDILKGWKCCQLCPGNSYFTFMQPLILNSFQFSLTLEIKQRGIDN